MLMKRITKIVFTLMLLLVVSTNKSLSTTIQQIDDAPSAQCPHAPQLPPHKGKGGCGFNKEKFVRELSNFIAKEAGMKKAEAREFLPIFFEMRESMRNIERQKERALRTAAKNNMAERDCQRVLNEWQELDKKSSRIEAQYMARLQKMVGARKLLKAIDADRRFGRRMFKQLTQAIKSN